MNMIRPHAGTGPDRNRCKELITDAPDGGKYMKTYVPGAADIEKKWYVVDATDMTLGRLASAVARHDPRTPCKRSCHCSSRQE